MINSVVLVGRLTKDIDLRKTPDGKSVVQFTLAVERPIKDDIADFPQVVVWQQGADYLNNYAVKGDIVGVTGRIQTRKYEGKNGTQYVTEVRADRVKLLSYKKKEEPVRNDFEPKQYDTYQTNHTNYQPTLSGGDSFAEDDFGKMGGSYDANESLGVDMDGLPFY